MLFRSLCVLFFLLHYSFNAFSFVTVGDPTDGCTFATLSEAINDAQLNAGDSEIFVTNEFVHEFSGTISQSLTIKGAYDNCASASAALQGTINSNWTKAFANTSVIRLEDNTAFNEDFVVTIDSFNIFGGVSATQAGGVNISSNSVGNSSVYINYSNIFNNQGMIGGGIITDGDRIFLDISNTEIYNNTSTTDGGGINCINGSTINTIDHSSIRNNTAINGGGVALDDCLLALESGDTLAAGSMQEGIFENTASTKGGGIYSYNSTALILGNNVSPASVSNNVSNGELYSGGGIYADESNIFITNGRIDLNTVNDWGAGIVAVNNSLFTMDRFAQRCWGDNSHCSSISGNVSIGQQQGISNAAAGHFDNNTNATIQNTVISSNVASVASVFSIFGAADINMEGNLIINNSSENSGTAFNLFNLADSLSNVKLDFAYNTIADNLANKIFVVRSLSAVPIRLNIGSSIIKQPNSAIVDRADAISLISMDCTMLSHNNTEDFSLYNIAFMAPFTDPLFVNANLGNYRLSESSQAIDYCDNVFLPVDLDITIKPRGLDDQTTQNFLGTYDLGAYEYQAESIFMNGFESL